MVEGRLASPHGCNIDIAKLKQLAIAAQPTTTTTSTDSSAIIEPNLSTLSLQSTQSDSFDLLTRLTVVLEDQNQVHSITSNAIVNSYDLVAVQPATEKLLHQACTAMESIDIISLDLSRRLPFQLKFSIVGVAIERGVMFEVLYTPLQSMRLLDGHDQGIIATFNLMPSLRRYRYLRDAQIRQVASRSSATC
mgnify:FL=1